MSDISELRLRVDAAEERFESVGDQQRQYGARLLSLMNAVEGGLSRKQAALEECTAELERVTAENEQLRGMLQSLLQAVESNGEDQLDDTMNSLDAMVTALTGGAAGAVEAQPEETVASGSEAVLVEDDEEVDTNLAETGEAEIGEEAPAEALVAAEAQENPVEDAAPLEEADTAEVEPETATEVEAAEDQAEELEVAAEAPEPATSEVDATDGVVDADTAEAGGGDLEPEETASEIPAAEADEAAAEASEDSAPQEAQEPQETAAEEPEPTASRSPVGDIIARISEKTKDFPSEEVVMDSLAKIEAGVLASEGETPTLDSEFDEADYIDPTAAAAS